MKNRFLVYLLLFIMIIPAFVYAEETKKEEAITSKEAIPTVGALDEVYQITVDKKKYAKEDKDNGKLYTYKDKNEVTSILIYYKENKYSLNISRYDKEDVKKQEDAFKTEMEEKYKTQNITAKINQLTSSTNKVNGYDSIIFDIETEYTFDKKTSVIYQKQYMFSSKKYVYYIIISSTKKDVLSNEEMTNMVSSFKINDKMFEKEKSLVEKVRLMFKDNAILFTAFFSLLIFTIIFTIGTRKKKKTV